MLFLHAARGYEAVINATYLSNPPYNKNHVPQINSNLRFC
jgi:hypothetical protein